MGDNAPLKLTEEGFERIIDVNLKGCLLSCQAVVPVMREQRSGSIVNISSIAAVAASIQLTAYKISKAGINALATRWRWRTPSIRRPCEHDHAWTPGHADGDRRMGGKAPGSPG